MDDATKVLEEGLLSDSIDARALHSVLGKKTSFSNWIKYKILQHSLTEGEDYTASSDSPGRAVDYSLTSTAALKIVMAENIPQASQLKEELIKVNAEQAKAFKAISKVELNLEDSPLTFLDNSPYVSSLKIAEVTGKLHRNVLRDIEAELKNVQDVSDKYCQLIDESAVVSGLRAEILSSCTQVLEGIKLTSYDDAQGKPRKAYLLNERATYQVLLRYSTEHRLLFVGYFLKMRDALDNMHNARAIDGVMPQALGKRQYVYIIRESDTGFLKIGVSNDPEHRLEQLQTGNSSELLLDYKSYVCSNAHEVEAKAHEHFKERRVNREWFDIETAEVIDYLTKRCYVLESLVDFSFGSKLNEVIASYTRPVTGEP